MSYLNRVDAEHVARMYAFQQLVKVSLRKMLMSM